jgi:hypothetical protein
VPRAAILKGLRRVMVHLLFVGAEFDTSFVSTHRAMPRLQRTAYGLV